MALYAFVTNGVVTALCSPPDGQTLAQVPGLTSAQIASAVAVPAGAQVGIGWTESGGVFTQPGGAPTPTLAQQAAAAISAGCSLVSTSTPALNAVYPADLETRSDIQAEVISLLKSSAFTNGGTTIAVPDITGVMRTFDVMQFEAFATEFATWYGTDKQVVVSNSGALAAQPITIA